MTAMEVMVPAITRLLVPAKKIKIVLSRIPFLTLDSGDNLAGDQTKEPLAPMQALGEGGGQANQAGKNTRDAKVEDVEVARVAVDILT